ncbi:MAG: anti-sigma factor domain-containing protein [Almyronema sp.]
MTGSMPSEEQQILIAGYVLGHLDAEEAAAFAQQMADNPALRQEVQRLQLALEAGFAPPEVKPPAHLRQAILQAAQSPVVAQLSPEAISLPPQTVQPAAVKALGAIAAVVIAALSLSNFLLWRSLQNLRLATAPPPTLQLDLEPTEATLSASSATVLVALDSLQATLTVENLPPLPADQVYVLWTVLVADAAYTTDAKNAILTQVFTVNEAGDLSQPIVVPPAFRDRTLIQAVAITVEAAAAPQRHQSAPILIERL